jgi:hypothetical protein
LGKRLAQKKMANDLTTWLQACRSRSEEEDVTFEGLEEIKAHIDPTDFIAFNCYERNLRIFSNFCLNTDSEQNPWVVVNTGDRYAARKALMLSFRSHLKDFESPRRSCSPCSPPKQLPPAHTRGLTTEDMMKNKFKRTWRHSRLAWLTGMGLLLLAFIYAENTDWEGAWYRTPTKYNITALLEGGDDDMMVGPGKPSSTTTTTTKKGKTGKDKPELPVEAPAVDVAPPGEEDGAPKAAKTAKAPKPEKVDDGSVEDLEGGKVNAEVEDGSLEESGGDEAEEGPEHIPDDAADVPAKKPKAAKVKPAVAGVDDGEVPAAGDATAEPPINEALGNE